MIVAVMFVVSVLLILDYVYCFVDTMKILDVYTLIAYSDKLYKGRTCIHTNAIQKISMRFADRHKIYTTATSQS